MGEVVSAAQKPRSKIAAIRSEIDRKSRGKVMGQVSTFEDILEAILERLDNGVARLRSPPDMKRGSISIESLRDTNDLLREKNGELMKLVYAVKADIESKRKTDFCKTECVRLKKANDLLVRRLEDRRDDETPFSSIFKNKATTAHQPKKVESTSQYLSESKQRARDAAKIVEAAQKDLKQAKEAHTKAQNEYQGLLQSERNSTKYIPHAGHGRRQLSGRQDRSSREDK